MSNYQVENVRRTLIIVLNWNCWRDTIECVHSLRWLEGSFDIAIIDNASTDASVFNISEWVKSSKHYPTTEAAWLPILKHSQIREHFEFVAADRLCSHDIGGVRLAVLEAPTNGGFAYGNNVGLRKYLNSGYDYFWLLNPDTLVHPAALKSLLARADASKQKVGITGAQIRFYGSPEKIQCLGGAIYRRARAGGDYIAYGKHDPGTTAEAIEKVMDYVCGASMFVSRDFIQSVGFMNEEYFLYFEEMDWTVRSHGQFEMGYAPLAIVYHKHGKVIGGASGAPPSKTNIIYSTRNRITFTKKYFPSFLILVACSIIIDALKLCAKGHAQMAALQIRMLALSIVSNNSLVGKVEI